MQLIGQPLDTWMRLERSVERGDFTLKVKSGHNRAVNWALGSTVLISTTDYHYNHSETRTITDLTYDEGSDTTTIVLDRPLDWDHQGLDYAYEGREELRGRMAAAVSQLDANNIKIQGEETPFAGRTALKDEQFGFKIHVLSRVDKTCSRVFNGLAIIDGVAMHDCGQKQDDEQACIFFERANKKSLIRNSVIWRAYQNGISYMPSAHNNVLYDVHFTGIRGCEEVTENLVALVYMYPGWPTGAAPKDAFVRAHCFVDNPGM